jgi:hypothetical protein
MVSARGRRRREPWQTLRGKRARRDFFNAAFGCGIEEGEAEIYSTIALNTLVGLQMTKGPIDAGRLADLYGHLTRLLTDPNRTVN